MIFIQTVCNITLKNSTIHGTVLPFLKLFLTIVWTKVAYKKILQGWNLTYLRFSKLWKVNV